MSVNAHGHQLKILVFATQNNPMAARISIALAHAGFHVAALTRSGHPAREVRKISRRFVYDTRSPSKSMVHAIDRWSPDFLVCTDDPAVGELQNLHKRLASSGDKAERRIANLIELSLGPPASFSVMSRKSDFLALA